MKRTLAPGVLAVLFVSISLYGGAAGAATWPKHLAGHLLDHRQSSMRFGSTVPRKDLLVGWMSSKNYRGKYSYALADIGNYEYPVSTVDHGQQWRVAGNYFNLDDTSGMGAGGSPSNIVTLSRSVAVAYRRGDIIGPESTIYVTVNSGTHWYLAFAPGAVLAIRAVLGGRNDSVLKSLIASVSTSQTTGGKRTYTTLNAGRSWSLN